jgi:hypothetical protein
MPEAKFDEPTLVRISVPLSVWLLEHKHASLPTTIGLLTMASTMIWMPWWARLICVTGMGLTLLGIELENLYHRMDGANTMMVLINEAHNERQR